MRQTEQKLFILQTELGRVILEADRIRREIHELKNNLYGTNEVLPPWKTLTRDELHGSNNACPPSLKTNSEVEEIDYCTITDGSTWDLGGQAGQDACKIDECESCT